MALEGSLKDFGLADILQLIYFQRKTGALSLDGKMDKVKLFFVDGNIVGAESKRRLEDNRLGKILVKKGFIKEEDLKAVLEEQHSTGIRLGTVLIQKGLVEKEKIQEIINAQITETVVQLFGWKQGTYEFTAQGVPQDKELPFSLDTQHLLMEGLRIVDELAAIKDRLTLDTLFTRTSAEGTGLDREEKDILSLVDGENDVSTIIDLAGMDNYEVSKILLSLAEKGFITSTEAAPVISAGAVPAEETVPSALLGYLPYLAVAASLILSFAVVLIQKDETMKVFSAAKMVDELRFTIEKYRLQHDAYPQTLSELTDAQDPWGHPFIYGISDNVYILKSAGPDKTEGTKDDIF
jgi:predicted transcriptional regulator